MQHTILENGRWAELSFLQQMANIGSETARIYRALEAGVDLTIKSGRTDASPMLRSAMLEELCRFRELYCKAYLERDLPELAAFNRYLDFFAFSAVLLRVEVEQRFVEFLTTGSG